MPNSVSMRLGLFACVCECERVWALNNGLWIRWQKINIAVYVEWNLKYDSELYCVSENWEEILQINPMPAFAFWMTKNFHQIKRYSETWTNLV